MPVWRQIFAAEVPANPAQARSNACAHRLLSGKSCRLPMSAFGHQLPFADGERLTASHGLQPLAAVK